MILASEELQLEIIDCVIQEGLLVSKVFEELWDWVANSHWFGKHNRYLAKAPLGCEIDVPLSSLTISWICYHEEALVASPLRYRGFLAWN